MEILGDTPDDNTDHNDRNDDGDDAFERVGFLIHDMIIARNWSVFDYDFVLNQIGVEIVIILEEVGRISFDESETGVWTSGR